MSSTYDALLESLSAEKQPETTGQPRTETPYDALLDLDVSQPVKREEKSQILGMVTDAANQYLQTFGRTAATDVALMSTAFGADEFAKKATGVAASMPAGSDWGLDPVMRSYEEERYFDLFKEIGRSVALGFDEASAHATVAIATVMAGRLAVQALGAGATYLIAGAAAPALLPLITPMLQTAGMTAGAAANMYGLGFGDAEVTIGEKIGREPTFAEYAPSGVVNAVLEAPFFKLVNRLGSRLPGFADTYFAKYTKKMEDIWNDPSDGLLVQMAKDTLVSGSTGGITEGLQQYQMILASQLINDKDAWWALDDAGRKEVLDSVYKGFMSEGALGAVTTGLKPKPEDPNPLATDIENAILDGRMTPEEAINAPAASRQTDNIPTLTPAPAAPSKNEPIAMINGQSVSPDALASKAIGVSTAGGQVQVTPGVFPINKKTQALREQLIQIARLAPDEATFTNTVLLGKTDFPELKVRLTQPVLAEIWAEAQQGKPKVDLTQRVGQDQIYTQGAPMGNIPSPRTKIDPNTLKNQLDPDAPIAENRNDSLQLETISTGQDLVNELKAATDFLEKEGETSYQMQNIGDTQFGTTPAAADAQMLNPYKSEDVAVPDQSGPLLATPIKGKAGRVSFVSDIPTEKTAKAQWVVDTLEKWLDTFGIADTTIEVGFLDESTAEGTKGQAQRGAGFKNRIQIRKEIFMGTQTNPAPWMSKTLKDENKLSETRILSIIAHEFGHILASNLISRMPEKIQRAIHNAYLRDLDQVRSALLQGQTVQQMQRTFASVLGAARPFLKYEGKDTYTTSSGDVSYWFNMEEWFANQVAKYIEKKLSYQEASFWSVPEHAKFMKHAVKTFRSLWANIKAFGGAEPNATVVTFLNALVYSQMITKTYKASDIGPNTKIGKLIRNYKRTYQRKALSRNRTLKTSLLKFDPKGGMNSTGYLPIDVPFRVVQPQSKGGLSDVARSVNNNVGSQTIVVLTTNPFATPDNVIGYDKMGDADAVATQYTMTAGMRATSIDAPVPNDLLQTQGLQGPMTWRKLLTSPSQNMNQLMKLIYAGYGVHGWYENLSSGGFQVIMNSEVGSYLEATPETAPEMQIEGPLPYNALSDVAASISMMKGTPEQMLAALRKAGAQPADLESTGLIEYLKTFAKTVTKEQIQDFLDNKGIDIVTVRLGEQGVFPPLTVITPKGDIMSARSFLQNAEALNSLDNEEADREYLADVKKELTSWIHNPDKPMPELLKLDGFIDLSNQDIQQAQRRYSVLAIGDINTLYYKSTALNAYLDNRQEHIFTSSQIPMQPAQHFQTPPEHPLKEEDQIAFARTSQAYYAGGEKGMFIDEIQSDRAQAGAKGAFIEHPTDAEIKAFLQLPESMSITDRNRRMLLEQYRIRQGQQEKDPIIAFPLIKQTSAWVNLVLRKLIDNAIEQDMPVVLLTPGIFPAIRYGKARVFTSIEHKPTRFNEDIFQLEDQWGKKISIYLLEDGRVSINRSQISDFDLKMMGIDELTLDGLFDKESANFIRDLTQKLRQNPEQTSAIERRIVLGGQGIMKFYDSIVPTVAERLLKKYNTSLVTLPIQHSVFFDWGRIPYEVKGFYITPEMKAEYARRHAKDKPTSPTPSAHPDPLQAKVIDDERNSSRNFFSDSLFNFGMPPGMIDSLQRPLKNTDNFMKIMAGRFQRPARFFNSPAQMNDRLNAGPNQAVPELDAYNLALRMWSAMKFSIMSKSDIVMQKWKALPHGQREEVSRFMYILDFESHNLGRRLTPVEQDILFQKIYGHAMVPKQLEVFNSVSQAFADSLDGMELGVVSKRLKALSRPFGRELSRIWAEEQKKGSNKATKVLAVMQMIHNLGVPYPASLQKDLETTVGHFDAMRDRNYFPLSRFGRFVVRIEKQDSKGNWVMTPGSQDLSGFYMFDTAKERQDFIKSVNLGNTYRAVTTVKIDDVAAQFVNMPSAFIDAVVDTIERSGATQLTAGQQAAVESLKLATGPSAALMKHLNRRSRVHGYSVDAIRTFAAYQMASAHNIARITHGEEMLIAIQDLKTSITAKQQAAIAGEWVDTNALGNIANFLSDHFKDINNPENDFPRIRQLCFLKFIGFSFANMALNITSLALLTGPIFVGRMISAGVPASKADLIVTKAMTKAALRALHKWGSAEKPDHYSQEELEIYDGLVARGTIVQTYARELAEAATPIPTAYKGQKKALELFDNIVALSAVGQNLTEEYVRRQAMLCSIDLRKRTSTWATLPLTEKVNLIDADIRAAVGEYSREMRAEVMKGKIKSNVLMFMNHVQHSMHIYTGGQDNHARFRALTILLLIGGIMGLPGAEDTEMLLSYLIQKYYKNDYFKIKEELRELSLLIVDNPEQLLYGLSGRENSILAPLGLLGVPVPELDMTGNISFGHLTSVTRQTYSFDDSPEERVAKTVVGSFGAPAAMTYGWYRAIYDRDMTTAARWKAILPNAAGAIMEAHQLVKEESVISQRGNYLGSFAEDDFESRTQYYATLMGVGLNIQASRISRMHEKMGALQDRSAFYGVRRMQLTDQLCQGYLAKDMGDALADIKQYNEDIKSQEGMLGYSFTSQQVAACRKYITMDAIRREGLPVRRTDIPMWEMLEVLYPEP